MIWPDNIPDEVVKAARQAWLGSDVNAMEDWRVAIAAAISEWPWKFTAESIKMPHIILPLPEAPQGRIAKQEEAGDV